MFKYFQQMSEVEKIFAAEPKLEELKKINKLKRLNKTDKIRVRPNDIIHKATNNMNKALSEKHEIEPEKVEIESLASESFRTKFDFHRL